jgi:hypothetical protein
MLAGHPYYFMDANFWQDMNLGVDSPSVNRDLLNQEFDQLQQLGVTNLRLITASEGPNTEPYRMVPALMDSPGAYNESVFDSLHYLLYQMGRRNMKVVLVLNNYWQLPLLAARLFEVENYPREKSLILQLIQAALAKLERGLLNPPEISRKKKTGLILPRDIN